MGNTGGTVGVMMRVWGAAAFLLCLAWGTLGAQQALVHIAPKPSERFPAAWYPPENNVTSTAAPVVGAPFAGTTVMTTAIDSGAGKPPVEARLSIIKMRDTAGRTRTEQALEVVNGVAQRRQIEVYDAVRHCTFRWVEPAKEPAKQVATVSCLSRRLNLTEDTMGDTILRQSPEVVHQARQTFKMEPLGEKAIAGIPAVGLRQTRTILDAEGKETSVLVTELWWSPELQEMVAMKPVGDAPGVSGFALTEMKLGEPDAGLFYPPAGWRIEGPGGVR